jgi:hypothetical protein
VKHPIGLSFAIALAACLVSCQVMLSRRHGVDESTWILALNIAAFPFAWFGLWVVLNGIGWLREVTGPGGEKAMSQLSNQASAVKPADPVEVVQRQLDAYNDHDLDAFIACYREDIRAYRPPAAEPVLSGKAQFADFYATERFNVRGLRAQVLSRMVLGRRVIDHERIYGLEERPAEVAAVYEVEDGLITTVWFFRAL